MASTITRKGQVTIPKEILDSFGLRVGDRVSFVARDNEIVIRPPRGTILDLRGSVEPRQRPEDFDEIRRKIQGKVARRAASNG